MPRFLRFLCLASASVLLSGFSDAPKSPSGRSEERKSTAKKPDAATIGKWVEQLDSPKFAERQEARKALEAIGLPALDALRKAARSTDTEVAHRATRLVEIIENGFDQLLADYRDYGLPLPPKDAKLVRFESGGRHVSNGKLMPPTYFLGFLLSPGTKKKPTRLLVGTQEVRLKAYRTFEVVEPKPELVKNINLSWWGPAVFESNAGLAIALQCKARGWDGLARELWTQSLKKDFGDYSGLFYHPANLPNRTAVAYLAWAYSGNELVKPDTDRSKTAKRMKALFVAERRLNTECNRALLKSLEAALIPSTAKPGTVERLIDDLTDMCNRGRQADEPDPHYARLAKMGFAAVPSLIAHLDDERLTRSIRQGFNNFPTWNLRVKHVASDLLQELAGEDVGKDWLQRQLGWEVERADAQAWWDKARKVGEEAYFLAHVLPNGEKAEWPNSLMLSIVTAKYPKHLPKLYETVLNERPKMQSWPLAEAIAKSSLPKNKKRELFLHAARNKNLEHRRFGLSELQKLDPQRFMTILLDTLDNLPKTPTEPYWKCPEVTFAHLVTETDVPRPWKLLAKVAKRSDVGLRMEFLNLMHNDDRQRRQRLEFLAAFLNDAEAPNVTAHPEMFSGPHAGFMFRRLAVRDLAAMRIASFLGLPDRPDRDWTPQQWEKLRKKVKKL
jgi:hypothetical protein